MGWESGRVWLEGDEIHCESYICGDWSLPLSAIRVIGEYTNQNGPGVDDYFFAFVISLNEMWREASFYAEGRESFLAELRTRLGCECSCLLYASTDFRSRVWWPAELAGKEMFEFRQEDLMDKLKMRNRQYLSATVRGYLEQNT